MPALALALSTLLTAPTPVAAAPITQVPQTQAVAAPSTQARAAIQAAPLPSQAPQGDTTASAELARELGEVYKPNLGFQLVGATAGPGGVSVEAKARSWKHVVRASPELSLLHRKSKLMYPGIALSAVGGAWAALAITATMDAGAPASHTGRLFAYGVPVALLSTGVPLLSIGLSNRKELQRKRVEFTAAPMMLGLETHGAKVGVKARF